MSSAWGQAWAQAWGAAWGALTRRRAVHLRSVIAPSVTLESPLQDIGD